MKSSYLSSINNFAPLLESITFIQEPCNIVEIGILDGFSLNCFINSTTEQCTITAYDIFEQFEGNHADYNYLNEKYKDNSRVNIKYGDFYNVGLKNGFSSKLYISAEKTNSE